MNEDESRIKFECRRIGELWEFVRDEKEKVEHAVKELGELLRYQEDHGFAPVAPNGFIGGNGAVLITISNQEYLLVSKSAKRPGEMNYHTDFCLIHSFNKESWSCDYYSTQEDIKPTSDTPMHYFLLKNVSGASAALHGHAIADEETARARNIPCSNTETLYSTPADTEAMFELLKEFPYPQHNIFVRKNHGFYILAESLVNAKNVLDTRLINVTI